MPGVVSVRPIIEGQVMATRRLAASRRAGARHKRRGPCGPALIARHRRPKPLAGFNDDNVMIGNRLALQLGIRTGDSITLISPQGTTTAFGTVPRIKTYHVAGTFDVGMYEYDNTLHLHAAAGGADLLQPATRPYRASRSSSPIPTMCAPTTARSPTRSAARHAIFDWQQSNFSFFNAVEVERNVMFLILTLIILVAAFNIISSMIMLVKDKGHDIAILRTMGATRGMILRIFILAGASIGIVGTLGRFRARRRLRRAHRGDPPLHPDRSSAPISSPPRSISSRRSRRASILTRSAPCSPWPSASRSSRRSIRPGGRRGSIRSRRSAMSEPA